MIVHAWSTLTVAQYNFSCLISMQLQNWQSSLHNTAGKTKTYDEVEEMLEGGDPAIFTSDVSTRKGNSFGNWSLC